MSLKSIIAITFVTIAYTSLQCVSVVMKDYRNVTTSDCGIGRHYRQNDCFEWHKGYHNLGDLHMGRDVTPGEMPWVVKVLIGPIWTVSLCTGVIVNTRCEGIACDPKSVRIYPENIHFYPMGSGSRIYAIKLFIHPMFNKTGKDPNYDIGIIELNWDLKFKKVDNYYLINSICLPIENYTQSQREMALISGWGIGYRTVEEFKDYLQIGWVSVMRTAINQTDGFGKLIRTWKSSEGSVATCLGDSGAPIMQYSDGRAVLIGILAIGKKVKGEYCTGYSITVKDSSVRISYHVNWIVNTIRNAN